MHDYTESIEYAEISSKYDFEVDQAADLSPSAVAQAAYIGHECARLKNEAARTKMLYKRKEAETTIEVVDFYESTGTKKNLDYIKAKVAVQPALIEVEEQYVAAEAAYQEMRAELDALTDRSMTMKVLVSYQKKQVALGAV